MKLTASVLDMDMRDVEGRITRFIKDYVRNSNAKGIVLGLSGGVDSCTVAALSAQAIGGDYVLGLMLPERETRSMKDLEHAKLTAEKFSFKWQSCDLTSTLEALYRSLPPFDPADKICKGNIKARLRMIFWYYYANKLDLIVCGCSDKSETMIGYFTKWGDVAADISPIMDLYKTQVRKLARHMGIPEEVVTKPPSPALWPDQTAEKEIGIGYEQLDLILYGLEHFMTAEEIANQIEVEQVFVESIKRRWLSTEHKRSMLLTTKLEYRTIGKDFRNKR